MKCCVKERSESYYRSNGLTAELTLFPRLQTILDQNEAGGYTSIMGKGYDDDDDDDDDDSDDDDGSIF